MKTDRIYGPIPPDKFKELAALPHGKAREVIRKYDPLWGRETGEKIKWDIKFTRKVAEEGHATVEAATEKEALKLAEKIPESQISWDSSFDADDMEIVSAEPAT